MCRRANSLLFLLLAGLLAMPAASLASAAPRSGGDSSQPMELTADHAEMNNATGVGVYTGNVVFTQGTMRITADKMTVYTTPDGELARAIAEGRNATFRQLPEGQTEYVHARASYMEYHPQEPGYILLRGNAVLTQGKNELTGDTIRYDMRQDTVTAESAEGSEQRVRIVIHPAKEGANEQQSDDGR